MYTDGVSGYVKVIETPEIQQDEMQQILQTHMQPIHYHQSKTR